ncbi:MAG: transposase [Acidimicrobiales bacterium]
MCCAREIEEISRPRNGTCDLFAALEIATDKVITDIRKTNFSADFVAFLNKVNRNLPDDLDVHVILDNLSAHKIPTVHRWLLRHRRFHLHFTPTYGSGMNLVWALDLSRPSPATARRASWAQGRQSRPCANEPIAPSNRRVTHRPALASEWAAAGGPPMTGPDLTPGVARR